MSRKVRPRAPGSVYLRHLVRRHELVIIRPRADPRQQYGQDNKAVPDGSGNCRQEHDEEHFEDVVLAEVHDGDCQPAREHGTVKKKHKKELDYFELRVAQLNLTRM